MNWGYLKSWFSYIFLYPLKKRRMDRFFSAFDLDQYSLIFDIGAHLGDKSRFFLEYNPDLEVVMVEPQPFFAERIADRFAGHDRVDLLKVALAANEGSKLLYLSSTHPTVATLDEGMTHMLTNCEGWTDVKWDNQLVIPTKTLDLLIDTYGIPDFVKLDVEGYEPEVLKGLSIPLSFLSFELLPAYPSSALQCIDRLNALSTYQFAFSRGEDFELHTDWLTGLEMKTWIESYNGHSGDIYARQIDK